MFPYLIAGAIGYAVAKIFESDEAPKYADGGSVLLAPNGKPSNLTPEQYKLVRKPEFKAWFGDWENDPANASKVVDSNGEPMVLYHGTDVNFNVYDLSKIGEGSDLLGKGIYLTENKDVANFYANLVAKKRYIKGYEDGFFGSTNAIYEEDADEKAEKHKLIYEFFVNAKNIKNINQININNELKQILIKSISFIFKDKSEDVINSRIDFADKNHNQIRNYRGKIIYLIEQFPDAKKEILEYIKNKYDCIFFEPTTEFESNLKDYKNYVIFKPNQIKLANGTNTTFDGNNPDIRYADGGDVDNKTLMKNDFLNEQNQLQRNSKYAILLDATWNNYTDEMRGIEDDLKNELIKKLGYNPLYNYFPFSDKDSKILMFDDDSNLLGLLIFTTEPKYTVVPRFSPSDIKPEKLFENNNNVFYLEYIFSFGKGNGQKMMNQIKKYADKYNVQIGLEGSVVEKSKGRYMASAKHLERFYDKQGFENVWGNYFIYIPNSKFAGGGDVKKVKFSIEEEEERTTISIKGIGEVILVETFPEYEFLEDVGEDGLEELGVEEGDMIGKIEHLEIDDKYKGKGYAKLLMNKAIEVAEEKGLMPLYLNASPMGSKRYGLDLDDLTGFYESFGFEVFLEQGNNNLMILK